jgi:PAS domain S-box-containing protein
MTAHENSENQVNNAKQTDFLAAIIQSSEDAIIGMDLNGIIKSWNNGAKKIFGYSANDVIGKSINIIYPPGYEKEFLSITDKINRGEQINHFETQRKRKDGEIFDVSLSFSKILNEKGELIGYSKIVRDFTTQRNTEKYARSLIEASLDPLVTISPDGKITDVNEATVEITGVSREKLIGSNFSDYFTDPEEAQEGYKQVLKEGFVVDYPLEIRHVSGQITDVLYNATLYKGSNGEVHGIFAAARDITKRKKAEEQLHAAFAYARSLIEASLDPLVTFS